MISAHSKLNSPQFLFYFKFVE